MPERKYFIHTVTPLHVGTGRGLGYIDLPIAREKVTNWPYVPGSSIKGVMRDKYEGDIDEQDAFNAAFGTSEGGDGTETGNAGSLVFTDANILFLPVRSFYGTFAWVTSPFCLERAKRNTKANFHVPNPERNTALITSTSVLSHGKIYLEELDIEAYELEAIDELAKSLAKILFHDDKDWQEIFIKRLAIVDDDIFTFLCDSGTEVNARIRIDDETRTVKPGALWYEETLPAETILTGSVWCDKVYLDGVNSDFLLNKYCDGIINLQIGGKASTGKGRVLCIFEG